MAIAGFLVAAVLLVGLKLALRGDPQAIPAATVADPVAQIEAMSAEDEAALEAELAAEEREAALKAEEEQALAEAEAQAEAAKVAAAARTRPATRAPVYTPPAQNYDDVAYFPEPEPEPVYDEDVLEGEEFERLRTDVSGFLAAAEDGQLSRNDIYDLEAIGTDDDSYTQARALLLMNAEKARSARDVKKYLDQLFMLDENRYSPVFLSKRARWFANNGKYDRALADAQKAEQHWARIPPDLVFPTKTGNFSRFKPPVSKACSTNQKTTSSCSTRQFVVGKNTSAMLNLAAGTSSITLRTKFASSTTLVLGCAEKGRPS